MLLKKTIFKIQRPEHELVLKKLWHGIADRELGTNKAGGFHRKLLPARKLVPTQ